MCPDKFYFSCRSPSLIHHPSLVSGQAALKPQRLTQALTKTMCRNSGLCYFLHRGAFPPGMAACSVYPRHTHTLPAAPAPAGAVCTPPAWEEAEGLRAAPPPPSWPSKPEVANLDCGCAAVGGCGARPDLLMLLSPSSLACSRSLWGGMRGTACPKAWDRILRVRQPCRLLPRASRKASPGPGRLPMPSDRTAAGSVQFLLVKDGKKGLTAGPEMVNRVIGDLKGLHRKITSRAAVHRGTFCFPAEISQLHLKHHTP